MSTKDKQEVTFDIENPAAVGALDRWLDAAGPGELRQASRDLEEFDIYTNDPAAGKHERRLTERIVQILDDVQAGERVRIGTKDYADGTNRRNSVVDAVERVQARGGHVEIMDRGTAKAVGMHANVVVTPRAAYAGTAHLSKGALDGAGSGRQSREIGIVSRDRETIERLGSWIDTLAAQGPAVVHAQRVTRGSLGGHLAEAKRVGDESRAAFIVNLIDDVRQRPLKHLDDVARSRADAKLAARALAGPDTAQRLGFDARTGPIAQGHLERVQADDAWAAIYRGWAAKIAADANGLATQGKD